MKFISLDIETYGACTHTHDGRPLPTQTVFHPARALHTDRCPPKDLILSVAVTTEASSCPCGKRRGQPAFSPCCTMVMYPHKHAYHITSWINWATDILGMNLPFDLQFLRHYSPALRFALSGRHTLHDLSILNYLHSELRPERSLKSLGPVLGTHMYDRTIKDGKFKSPHDPEFISYAAQDTHNTMLAARELRRRIHQDWPDSGKIDQPSVTHYSNLLWTIISMAEAGIPMDTRMLHAMEQRLILKDQLSSQLAYSVGVQLQGTGSAKCKEAFLSRCITLANSHSNTNILDHPLLQYTEKTRQISWSDGNRQLILAHLPASSPEARGLWLAGVQARTQKQLSSYIYPLLHGRRNQPENKGDTVIPWPDSNQSNQNKSKSSSRSPIHSATSSSPAGSTSLSSSRTWSTCTSPTSSTTKQSSTQWATSSSVESPSTQTTRSTVGASVQSSTQRSSDSSTTPSSSSKASPTARSQSKPRPLTPSTSTTTWTTTHSADRRATGAAYPVWYPVPSAQKDASGGDGGTIQGRITCKHPSAQTFPPEIKACIQSRWPSGEIISMDLSQVELRVAALCSGDPSLMAAFTSGLDLHTDRAIQLFGPDSVNRPTFKKRERQVGKTMNFADLFLASPQRMRMSVHEMTGELMPLPFFEQVANSRPAARPGLHRWQQSLISRVATDGYLLLPIFGQSRTFVGGPAAHLNEVVNFPIQTQASNTLLQIQASLCSMLPTLNKQGPRILMFLQVYDAIYFDVPPGQGDTLRAMVKEAVAQVASPDGYWGKLQSHYGNVVPLEYDID